MKIILSLFLILCFRATMPAQDRYELSTGWRCLPMQETTDGGETISTTTYSLARWKTAIVPGTVLTTQLHNGEIPDPFYAANNNAIPDIYHTGRDYYTWWFACDFREMPPANGRQVWITFRGINYRCTLYLNGNKINREPCEGMFLRHTFNVTPFLSPQGHNRLAVIVHPVDHVGKPNGGQGGDGSIARNVAHQYVAGWDWIQPVRDRNTGIWDKVFVERTGAVNLKNPHITTQVPGIRTPGDVQPPVHLTVSAELENTSTQKISGRLACRFNNTNFSIPVSLPALSTTEVTLPVHHIENPRLWWPSGYGEPYLYPLELSFTIAGKTTASDRETLSVGLREIHTHRNTNTRSMQFLVNGQPIFVKGGNWILSDALLRFSRERYDAEVRYHRDMNLNLIRVWGGALTERPEFYEACDRYGMLVIQDFWFSGDCNGRWLDPLKTDNQWTRRQYPDNHRLAIASAADMIRMIRNHPSLAAWCGGNEIMPPDDILLALRNDLLPRLDGTRRFLDYSNSDEWSYNFIGGNGDGPYTIRPVETFWNQQTWPFNSEVGSVGVGDYESLKRFLPPANMLPPRYHPGAPFDEEVDSLWSYHHYTGVGYGNFIAPYGDPTDVRDFARKAQLVNYDQYRALAEGFSSHIWQWYTGFIVWKTQNPWTSMRGQMYDCYLDPNACLFGLRKGNEHLHVMCHPQTGVVMIVNNGVQEMRNMMIVARAYDMQGRDTLLAQEFVYIGASNARKYFSVKSAMDRLTKKDGAFLYLQLLDGDQRLLSDNFYWYPDANGRYSGLATMPSADITVRTEVLGEGRLAVLLTNPPLRPVSFFNRISLINAATGRRVLPAFYDDNYVSVLPGTTKRIIVEYAPQPEVRVEVVVEDFYCSKRSSITISD